VRVEVCLCDQQDDTTCVLKAQKPCLGRWGVAEVSPKAYFPKACIHGIWRILLSWLLTKTGLRTWAVVEEDGEQAEIIAESRVGLLRMERLPLGTCMIEGSFMVLRSEYLGMEQRRETWKKWAADESSMSTQTCRDRY